MGRVAARAQASACLMLPCHPMPCRAHAEPRLAAHEDSFRKQQPKRRGSNGCNSSLGWVVEASVQPFKEGSKAGHLAAPLGVAVHCTGRQAGGQAGRQAGGQAGRRAGGQAGRRAGRRAELQMRQALLWLWLASNPQPLPAPERGPAKAGHSAGETRAPGSAPAVGLMAPNSPVPK